MENTITPVRKPWKGTMNARERFNRQMHFQSVDRCFNMEDGYWKETFNQWDIFLENNIKGNGDADVFFAFDPIAFYGEETKWMYPLFEEEVLEKKDGTQIIRNENGIIVEFADNRRINMPRFISSPITTPEDWDRLKKERFDPDDPARVPYLEDIKRDNPPGRDYPMGVYCGSMVGKIRDLLTFEGICYASVIYPEMIEDMVETCCILVERFLDRVLGEIDFDFAYGWEDMCYKSGPILSPAFFRDIVAPRYKRINEKLKKHGIDVWFTDCDGDVRLLLPVFLESGINCMFPYEAVCMPHPGHLLEQYEGLRIMGGVDKMKLKAGPEATREYLESLVPYVEKGGFIPFCDHRCPPDVSPHNYLYYLDLKEMLFGMG